GRSFRRSDRRGRSRLPLPRSRPPSLSDGRRALLDGRARGSGLRARLHSSRHGHGAKLPVQAPPAGDRESLTPDDRSGFSLREGLGEMTGGSTPGTLYVIATP